MEQAITTEQALVDRVVAELIRRLRREPAPEQIEPDAAHEPDAHYLAIGDLILTLFPAEEAETTELGKAPAADLHFEDDPAAIEEPRQAQGLPGDLTGFVFGRLEVIERSDVPGYWRVLCSCGIDKQVSREALRTGSARSCGCARLGLGPLRENTVNLIGQRFGKLTVIGRARPQRAATAWRCRCLCGRFAEYRSDMLRAGRRVSCGCAEKSNKVQMLGRSFGKLRVLSQEPGPSGSKEAHYLCRCACGGETVTRGGHLRKGHTTSCGCEKQATHFAPGNTIGLATQFQFQPGIRRRSIDDHVKADLLTEFRDRGATTDGRWFRFANGSCVRQGALRARIAKSLGVERGTPMGRATKVRVGRIFKSVVAGLAGSAEPQAA
jgi:hypothetical protein